VAISTKSQFGQRVTFYTLRHPRSEIAAVILGDGIKSREAVLEEMAAAISSKAKRYTPGIKLSKKFEL
jgi:hypothetical protein